MDALDAETSAILLVLMSEINEGVLILDKDHTVQLSNSTAQQLLRLQPNGRSLSELFIIPSGCSCHIILQKLRCEAEITLEDGQSECPRTYTLRTPHTNPSHECIVLFFSPQSHNPNDEAVSHPSASSDDSAQTSLDQFVYVISHDLQEPLRSVASYADLFAKRYADSLDEKGQKYIRNVVMGAKRMQAMIRDLLTLSRLPSQTQSFKPVNLSDVLDSVITKMRPHLHEVDACIEHDKLPTISGDPQQISLVFQNFINNALKYSGDLPAHIKISAELASDNHWVITFSDQGIGVDPTNHTRIFNIFQRVNTKDKYNGTGMGLAMVDNIIRRHKGRCWVESSLGQGAKFCFSIPNQTI